jgi:DNA polymerase III epsilon subunit-like protein
MPTPAFQHLDGNILAAVDVETTGRVPGYHEIIQIAIQILDSDCKPTDQFFYHTIKPEHKDRVEPRATAVHRLDVDHLILHAPDKWQVADWLDDWWSNLDLPFKKTMVPLAQNWRYDSSFLIHWLGLESFNQFFYWEARDTMRAATFLNDVAYWRGKKKPFPFPGLESLCNKLGIKNENPHDALADARAEGEVYRRLLEMGN